MQGEVKASTEPRRGSHGHGVLPAQWKDTRHACSQGGNPQLWLHSSGPRQLLNLIGELLGQGEEGAKGTGAYHSHSGHHPH